MLHCNLVGATGTKFFQCSTIGNIDDFQQMGVPVRNHKAGVQVVVQDDLFPANLVEKVGQSVHDMQRGVDQGIVKGEAAGFCVSMQCRNV